jgi:acyl carrier protein
MLITLEDVCRTSIDVLNVIVTLEQKCGVSIDEASMAAVSTVRDLYDLVLKSPHAAVPPADPARPA